MARNTNRRAAGLATGSDELPHWNAILVLAAHPDDETIGAGALLASAGAATIVHVTDGAPRDRRFWPAGLTGTRDAYARLRRRELALALREGGVMHASMLPLGVPDQEAVFHLRDLAIAFHRMLGQERPALLLTHPYEGGHPDHDAAALVAHSALELLRREGWPVPMLVEMTSYHARGEALETGAFLEHSRFPEVARVLPAGVRERKQRMLAAFASQRAVLAPFGVSIERFRRAPAYDFTAPPHAGPPWYERMGFPIGGEQWRALARGALRQLGIERAADVADAHA